MKKILSLVVVLALVLSFAAFAEAPAGYPANAINLNVGFGAGGDTDLSNRAMATAMEKKLGVSIAVNNVTGSNGAVCMAQYQSEPTDGYTIIAANTNAVLSNYSNGTSEFGYQDYEVIGVFCQTAGDMLFANKASGITSLDDLFAQAAERPFEINLGCAFGGLTQAYALLLENAGLDVNIVDGGDGANRIAYLVGGHVDVCFVPYASAKEYMETGDVVPLATIASSSSVLPDVPCINVVDGIDNAFDGAYIWMCPKGTDPAIVAYLQACMQDVIDNDADFAAEQIKYTYNDVCGYTGEAALEWLAANQLVADANAAVLK